MSEACGSWEVSYEWASQAEFCHWVSARPKSTPSIDSRCHLPQFLSGCSSSCFDTWVSVRCPSVRRFHRPTWLETPSHFEPKLSSIKLVREKMAAYTDKGGWMVHGLIHGIEVRVSSLNWSFLFGGDSTCPRHRLVLPLVVFKEFIHLRWRLLKKFFVWMPLFLIRPEIGQVRCRIPCPWLNVLCMVLKANYTLEVQRGVQRGGTGRECRSHSGCCCVEIIHILTIITKKMGFWGFGGIEILEQILGNPCRILVES